MAKKLVIVESPAKARTLSKILGRSYEIKASRGHVRDLPKKKLGVDMEGGFIPEYVVPREKMKVVSELRKAAKGASSIYLATDPDREGEAISWHLVKAAKLDGTPVHRVVFHEITEEAIKQAFRHPRAIDMHLVNAQQTRRILDRLVGYKISPLLWRKVRRGLSAGRVQSPALRMIVDRERQIQSFSPQEYWSIEAELAKDLATGGQGFRAVLIGLIGGTKLEIPHRQEAERLVSELERASYIVLKARTKEVSRQPAPPFITSTLQQEAWNKLRFAAKHTMAIAQQLYEGLPVGEEGTVGLITYMRTDSTRVAATAIAETRDFIGEKFGAKFLPSRPRTFAGKAKLAQEAHEAIRPTKVHREPISLKPFLTPDQFKLYDLIWKRMVASQMSSALFDTTTVDIEARGHDHGPRYLLRAVRSVIKFPGFMTIYSEAKGDDEREQVKPPLPELEKGDRLRLLGLFPEQHFTQPPPRYTEATLVKALEQNGIGRPSTYAPILSTIQERGYVQKIDGRFYPQELGIIVSDLLTEHFPDIVDLGFTALMEKELDEIAKGEREWVPFLQDFYTPFEETLRQASSRIDRVKIAEEPTDEVCPECGQPMVVKWGRYGKFLACSGYPQCKGTRPFLVKIGVACPLCGGEVVERVNKRKRVFYGCANYPQCQFVSGQRPLPQACPHCGGFLTLYRKRWVKCTKCQYQGKLVDLDSEITE